MTRDCAPERIPLALQLVEISMQGLQLPQRPCMVPILVRNALLWINICRAEQTIFAPIDDVSKKKIRYELFLTALSEALGL